SLHADAPLYLSALSGQQTFEWIDGIVWDLSGIRRIGIHTAEREEESGLSLGIRVVAGARCRIQRLIPDFQEHHIDASVFLENSGRPESGCRQNNAIQVFIRRKISTDVHNFPVKENIERRDEESVWTERAKLEWRVGYSTGSGEFQE